MVKQKQFFLVLFFCVSFSLLCKGQSFEVTPPSLALKTNVLSWATGTLNVGAEAGIAKRYTLSLSAGYNPWTFSDNRKLKHWVVQPEIRYWLCEKFNGHFFGLHAHGGEFNMGGIKLLGMEKYRYEGTAIGAGLSYGYQWILSNRWNIEASLGLGYTHLDYSKYYCEKCGEKIGDEKKHFVGPTKAAISLIYIIK